MTLNELHLDFVQFKTQMRADFDAAISRIDERFARVWKAGIGVGTVCFALLVDAVNDGFDLGSIAAVFAG